MKRSIGRWAAFALMLCGLAAPLVAAGGEEKKEPEKAPRIAVEPMSFDFGKALQNKTLHKDFVVRNFGTADLEIKNLSTTCGCTAAMADSTVMSTAPGRTNSSPAISPPHTPWSSHPT